MILNRLNIASVKDTTYQLSNFCGDQRENLGGNLDINDPEIFTCCTI